MAKPDMFRILGCIVMVTLILVIAVKLSKQCMVHPPMSASATATATPSPSATPGAHGVCGSGYRPDHNGMCVPN